FNQAVDAIAAAGGGDCPELAMRAVGRAIGASRSDGLVYLITDASAKDAKEVNSVVTQARAKRVPVSALLYGTCLAAADSQAAPPAPTPSNVDPAYITLANDTGG